jgi:hypothetical protein
MSEKIHPFKFEVGDLLKKGKKGKKGYSYPEHLLVLRIDQVTVYLFPGYYCLDPSTEQYYDLSTVHVHRFYNKEA